MPKRNRNRSKRSKKGGFLGFGEDSTGSSGSSSGTGWFDSLKKKSGSASSWFSSDPAPATPPATPPPTPPTTTPPPNPPPTTSSFGGKMRRHKSRRMRGGYSDNVSMTNLASRAAPFSGETVRPQAYVGGRRTKKRCHKHKGSRKRHCRK